MNLFQFTLAFGLLFSFSLFGQNTTPHFKCASDEAMAHFYQAYPEKAAEQKGLEKTMQEKMATESHGAMMSYSLPVVVHIIHQNGPENISDAQVETAIEQMNQAFSHTGYYADQGGGHDTEIQFCLAKRDADGNLTNGITRHDSPLTDMVMETEDLPLKDLARWEPLDYINIYVVNSITSLSSGPGVAGYAYLANAHGSPEDGIVCEAAYFGTNPADNSVLIHEMGHYLNLFHTFQSGCPNDDCTTQGDRVCDTPPDQTTFSACGFNSCDTDLDDVSINNPLTADENDLTENYMDYSPLPCYHAFTPGQADRMQAAIELFRFSLIDSKGCLDPCSLPVTIDFTASATEIFAGQTVNFTNNSTGATLFEWSVDGVPFATTEDASFTFNDVGVFEVELFITNADANCFELLSIFINVKCPVIPDFTPSSLTVEVGEPFTATNISQNATDYEWYINGVLITTDEDLSFVFSDAGIYTVLLVATDGGCVNEASQIIEVVSGSPCQDSVTNEWYHLNINGPLGFQAMAPNKDFFILSYPTFEDRVIFKIDEDENLLWSKKFDSPSVSFQNTTTNDGGLLFHFDSGIPNQRGICKLDENGNVLWAKSYSNYSFNKIDTYEDGALIYDGNPGGEFQSLGINNDGDVTWNRLFSVEESIGAETCKRNYDGTGWWCVGHNAVDERGGRVLKLNDVGDIEFYRRFIDTGNNFIFFADIAPTPDGGFVTVGERKDPDSDFIMAKFDSQGELEWERHIGEDAPTPLDETGDQVFLHPSGEYVGKYSTSFPDYLNIWFTCSTSGEISDLKSAVWENSGESLRFSLVKIDNQFYAYGNNPVNNGEVFLVDFSFETGPDLDCIEIIERQATPYSIGLTKYELSFNFLDTAEISDFTIGELPHNHEIIRTPACTTPCPEICDNGLDDDGDGYIDCFDVDCECFDGTDCEAEEPINNFTAQLAWQTPEDGVNYFATPIVANLDPQNGAMPEIIVAKGGQNPLGAQPELLIFQGDGSDADSPLELVAPEGSAISSTPPPIVLDVNNDGRPEIAILCGDAKIRVFNNFDPTANPPMSLWVTSQDEAWNFRGIPNAADFDQDGTPEIYIGNDVFRFDLSDPTAPTLKLVLNGDGHYGQMGPLTSSTSSSATIAADFLSENDCADPDCAGLELAAGKHIYSVDFDLFDGDGIEIKIQRDLELLNPSFFYEDGLTSTADVNHDGFLDVLLASEQNMVQGLSAYDKDGLLGFFPYPLNSADRMGIAAVANIYDDTQDGFAQDLPEIICVSRLRITAFNLNALSANPTAPYWWTVQTQDNSGSTGLSVFDFNGDGFSEIVLRDEDFFRIMYGGNAPFPPGVGADRNWMSLNAYSQTHMEYPIVADCDADGEAEILFTGTTTPDPSLFETRGRLWVMESADFPWLPCRPLWNQYSYFGVNVDDDLSIPAVQQNHHLEFPALGSGNRPYNRFLAQAPTLDEDFLPFYPVADALVFIDSSQCEGDSIRLWLTICNEGSTDLPSDMPIAFYEEDPRAVNAVPLFPLVFLGENLSTDRCANLDVVIPALFDVPVFIVANDDQTLPLPYAPTVDFPSTGIVECDYENNFAEFLENTTTTPLDLGPDLVICESSVIAIDAGGPYDSYLWQDGSTEQIFTAFGPGTYWVTVRPACGSLLSDTIEIILDQTATFDLGPDLTLCPGQSAELSVTGFDEVTWWPEEGLDCVDCPTVYASPADPVTYYATGQNGDCFATDSIQIFVENFELKIEVDQEDCDSIATLSALITGEGTFDFLWSNGETTDFTNITQSGIYEVTVTNLNTACPLADTVEITLDGLAIIDLGSDTTLCLGESLELSVLGFSSVDWSPTDILDCADCPAVIATPMETVTIFAAASNGSCSGSDSIQIFVETILLELTTDTLTCSDPVGLIGVDSLPTSTTYIWSGPNGFSANQPTANVNTPGAYMVTVTNTLSECSATGDLLVEADTLSPMAEILGNGNTIECDSLTTALDASASSQGSEFVYEWSPLSGISSGANTLSPQVNQSGIFTLLVTNENNGCTSTDEVAVTAEDAPEIIAYDTASVGCDGTPPGQIEITQAVGGAPPLSFSLNGQAPSTDLVFGNLPVGNYTLQVMDMNDCQSEINVEIGQLSGLSVTLTGDTLVNPDQPFEILAEVSPPNTVLSEITWQPGGFPAQLSINVAITNETQFSITVTDTSGCSATDDLFIQLFRPGNNVYFPNVIHPDSPNGENTHFTGFGGNSVRLIRNLRIFDRWGGLAFEGKNLSPNDTASGWDGTVDGEPANQGVYAFVAEVEFDDGEVTQVTGNVTLIR